MLENVILILDQILDELQMARENLVLGELRQDGIINLCSGKG